MSLMHLSHPLLCRMDRLHGSSTAGFAADLSSCTDTAAELWTAGEVSKDQYSAAMWYKLLQPLLLVQTSRDETAGHHLCPSGDSLGTALCGDRDGHRLPLSLPSGCAQGAMFTHLLPRAGSIPICMCHEYSKNWWVLSGEVRKRESCPGENHPGCVHTVPSSPSRAGQRSMDSLLLPAVSPLSWGGKTHALMGKHYPLNESDPGFWGQKTHHRLINKPVFVLFPELQVLDP